MPDIHETDLQVDEHNGTVIWYQKKRTLVIWPLDKTILHRDTLNHPILSNLISGQRVGKHSLEESKNSMILAKGKNPVYYMHRNDRGGLWISREELQPSTGTDNIAWVPNTPKEYRELCKRYGHISYQILSSLLECLSLKVRYHYRAFGKGKATKPLAYNRSDLIIRT